MWLYLYLLHIFLPLLSFFSFTGCQMVSVFGTLWFHYSISKSLSWSWGLGVVRFRQLASWPAPLTEDRYSARIQGHGPDIQLVRPLSSMADWASCSQHLSAAKHIHRKEYGERQLSVTLPLFVLGTSYKWLLWSIKMQFFFCFFFNKFSESEFSFHQSFFWFIWKLLTEIKSLVFHILNLYF